MKSSEIAIIAKTSNVTIFNSIGMDTYIISDIQAVDKKIFELASAGCKIVYISENIYVDIEETLDKYKDVPYPIILPLPIDEKSLGIGEKKIKDSVEKAIGINIF